MSRFVCLFFLKINKLFKVPNKQTFHAYFYDNTFPPTDLLKHSANYQGTGNEIKYVCLSYVCLSLSFVFILLQELMTYCLI
jgi:hypothetical protein